MPVHYVPPDPAVAEMIYRNQQELETQRAALSSASNAELKRILADPREPSAARHIALERLIRLRETGIGLILSELLDDADEGIAGQAICYVLGFLRRDGLSYDDAIDRLHQLLDSPRPQLRAEAALALARVEDASLLPRLAEWFAGPDRSWRNVAIEALQRMKTPAALQLFLTAWEQGPLDDEDCIILAAALLERSDRRGLEFLETTARKATGVWSVVAATSVYVRDPQCGLELMRHILSVGDQEALSGMVSQIWNFAHLPHAFTADGLDEAQVWVDQQLQKYVTVT